MTRVGKLRHMNKGGDLICFIEGTVSGLCRAAGKAQSRWRRVLENLDLLSEKRSLFRGLEAGSGVVVEKMFRIF